jgi:hypothetical protein
MLKKEKRMKINHYVNNSNIVQNQLLTCCCSLCHQQKTFSAEHHRCLLELA